MGTSASPYLVSFPDQSPYWAGDWSCSLTLCPVVQLAERDREILLKKKCIADGEALWEVRPQHNKFDLNVVPLAKHGTLVISYHKPT